MIKIKSVVGMCVRHEVDLIQVPRHEVSESKMVFKGDEMKSSERNETEEEKKQNREQ
jgi:hypothetical protein